MNFDAILFDCDGVLVDSEAITNQVITDTLNKHGGNNLMVNEVIPLFLGRALRDCTEIIAQLIGKPPTELFFSEFIHHRDKTLALNVQAVQHIPKILQQLSNHQIPFAVASGADLQKMQVTLGKTGLLPLFEGRMFGKDHVKQSKPAPDVYLYAAQVLNLNPSRCIVIEDTPTGVKSGVAAGAKVIAYAGAPHSCANELLNAGAIMVISSMAVLPDILGF